MNKAHKEEILRLVDTVRAADIIEHDTRRYGGFDHKVTPSAGEAMSNLRAYLDGLVAEGKRDVIGYGVHCKLGVVRVFDLEYDAHEYAGDPKRLAQFKPYTVIPVYREEKPE